MTAPADPPVLSILVVDDEPELRALLAEYLERHGARVTTAVDAVQARARVAAQSFDLAVLDVNMPGENGLSLARFLREAHPRMGLVMLTAVRDSVDRVVGLEIGADDYLPKPFDLRELLARIRAVMRRTAASAWSAPRRETASAPATIAFGDCRLDLERHCLLAADGQAIEITAAEFDLLALFARHPGRPLTRDQIMEQAHHRSWDVFDRSIDLRIMRLRRKIERDADKPDVIKTVRGVGYVFASKAPGDAGR
jgi:two-component system phosphate regulon response regulator OmpR